MGRSGYSYDLDEWSTIRWRGAVLSALRGKRGQAFLREMLESLDALPAPRLIPEKLVANGDCCAMGAVAMKRKLDVSQVDEYDPEAVGSTFGIPYSLAAEIAYINDEEPGRHAEETPEQRFVRVRRWVVGQLKVPVLA